MTKQNYIILGTILIIVFVLAGAVLVREKRQGSVEPITQPTATSIQPTSYPLQPTYSSSTPEGWKTYRNEEFGFEIKYPEGWIVEENDVKTTFSIFNKKIHEKEEAILKNSAGTDASPYKIVLKVFKFDGNTESFIKILYNNEIIDKKDVAFPNTNMKGIVISHYWGDSTIFFSPKYAFEFFTIGGIREAWGEYVKYYDDSIDKLIISTFTFLL